MTAPRSERRSVSQRAKSDGEIVDRLPLEHVEEPSSRLRGSRTVTEHVDHHQQHARRPISRTHAKSPESVWPWCRSRGDRPLDAARPSALIGPT